VPPPHDQSKLQQISPDAGRFGSNPAVVWIAFACLASCGTWAFGQDTAPRSPQGPVSQRSLSPKPTHMSSITARWPAGPHPAPPGSLQPPLAAHTSFSRRCRGTAAPRALLPWPLCLQGDARPLRLCWAEAVKLMTALAAGRGSVLPTSCPAPGARLGRGDACAEPCLLQSGLGAATGPCHVLLGCPVPPDVMGALRGGGKGRAPLAGHGPPPAPGCCTGYGARLGWARRPFPCGVMLGLCKGTPSLWGDAGVGKGTPSLWGDAGVGKETLSLWGGVGVGGGPSLRGDA